MSNSQDKGECSDDDYSGRCKVAVLVGSLHAASLTPKLARALVALTPGDLACAIVEIGDLPLYNEDLEIDAPPAWMRFRGARVQPLDPQLPQERDQ